MVLLRSSDDSCSGKHKTKKVILMKIRNQGVIVVVASRRGKRSKRKKNSRPMLTTRGPNFMVRPSSLPCDHDDQHEISSKVMANTSFISLVPNKKRTLFCPGERAGAFAIKGFFAARGRSDAHARKNSPLTTSTV
jgi:hypothetical protein